jgi:hypothetical protein
MFDNAAFETFRETVLEPEKRRLERLRMEVPSDQIMYHERIMGQWAQADSWTRKKETLADEMRLIMAQRQEQDKVLADGERKLNHELKKRIGE